MPAKKDSLKKALLSAIRKYAREECTNFPCAFRDALTDMRHIADSSVECINYPLADKAAEKVYLEECQ